MFNGCSNLTSLDLSNWDTSKVTTMHSMFLGCSALGYLNINDWDVSNLTSVDSMFHGAGNGNLELDLSEWNTEKLTSARGVLRESNIKKANLSGWNTGNITSLWYFCMYASKLEYLDLSGWNTQKVTETTNMFDGCTLMDDLRWTNWYPSVDLTKARNLPSDVLKNLLSNLATVTDGQTLTLGSTNLAKLTDNDKKIAIDKGWTLA